MGGKKTRDEYRIDDVIRSVTKIDGVYLENGSRHTYLLKYRFASVGNCALGNSTSVDRQLIGWLKKVTGYSKNKICEGLKTRNWTPFYV